MSTNGYRLMEGSGMQLNLLDPTESGFIRNALKAKLDGLGWLSAADHGNPADQRRAAGDVVAAAPYRVDASCHQRKLFDGLYRLRTDDFNAEGNAAARGAIQGYDQVFGTFEGNPMAWVMQFRNKMAWSIKTLANNTTSIHSWQRWASSHCLLRQCCR